MLGFYGDELRIEFAIGDELGEVLNDMSLRGNGIR
jgi:hypothetical protein